MLGSSLLACGSGHVAAPPTERALTTRSSLGLGAFASRATTLRAGEDAARHALFDLLAGIVGRDVDALRRLIAEEPVNVYTLRAGHDLPAAFVPGSRESVLRRLMGSQLRTRAPAEVSLADLVDPGAVEISAARLYFAGPVPGGLEPDDLVVIFEIDSSAARALQAVAIEGRGAIVVRITPDGAVVVGL